MSKFKVGDIVKITKVRSDDGCMAKVGGIDIIVDPDYKKNSPYTVKLKSELCIRPDALKKLVVGETVRCTLNGSWKGVDMTIVDIWETSKGISCKHPVHGVGGFSIKELKVVEDKMSKYETLRRKIKVECVNGWDKNMDDVLQEIFYKYCNGTPEITICCISRANSSVTVRNGNSNENIAPKSFYYNSQCEKNSAFQEALLYLLDNSSLRKDDKKTQIQEKIDKLQEELQELN